MQTRLSLWCTAAAMSLACLAGCSPPAEMPAGNWVGVGTYADYEGVLAKDQPRPAERSRSRTYETTLTIAKARAYGRDAWKFEIRSKRGKLLNLDGEETELSGLLVRLETIKGGATFYALLSADDAEAAKADKDLPPGTPAQASSVWTPQGLVLQVNYARPGSKDGVFTDTFHFGPGRVMKTGVYSFSRGSDDDLKLASVWWVEELRPAP